MGYIGKQPQLQGSYDLADDISSSFDGTATTFDIKVNGVYRAVGKETNIIVVIGNNIYKPVADYTLGSSNGVDKDKIIFASAPASGSSCSITILGDVFKAPTTGNTDLNSLTDVNVGSPVDDQVLKYQGGTWVNGPQGTTFISNNDDVDTSTANTDDKLVFDGTKWIPEADTLDNVNDVEYPSAPVDKQVLTWDDASSKWVPKDTEKVTKTISDLDDVNVSSPSKDQILTWSGTEWVAQDAQSTVNDINDLDDVDTSTNAPTAGQSLIWNDSTNKWEPGIPERDVNSLTDVDTTTSVPDDGDALAWDSTKSKWVPRPVTGGGTTMSIDDLTDVDTTTHTPSVSQVLSWDGSNWIPTNMSGGGGGAEIADGDIEIYVNADTGDDTNGDGSDTSPYATIEKAVSEAHKKITGNGSIIIICRRMTQYTITSPIYIRHPNKIMIRNSDYYAGTEFHINNTSTDTNPIFVIENGSLVIQGCKFGIYTPICDLKAGSSIEIRYSSGDVDKLCVDLISNNYSIPKIALVNSNINVKSLNVLNRIDNLYSYNSQINITDDTSVEIFDINYSNLNYFDVKLSAANDKLSGTSLFTLTNCNGNYVYVSLLSTISGVSEDSEKGIFYFDTCIVNKLKLNIDDDNTLNFIGFKDCDINSIEYYNNN